MIETLYFGIGFLIYVSYTILTFNMFSKKKGEVNFYLFVLIYLYYTLLASYVINFIDVDGSFFEKFIQVGIYAIFGGVVVFFHYNQYLMPEIKNEYDYNKPRI